MAAFTSPKRVAAWGRYIASHLGMHGTRLRRGHPRLKKSKRKLLRNF